MRQNIKSLTGFSISATDGELGKVKDFYFDDESWTIRYLIVETGSWLIGRKVLISPRAITGTDVEGGSFVSNLTQEQVKSSPDIDTEKPVSRQHELELYQHYPWGNYYGGVLWGGGMDVTGMMLPGYDSVGAKELQKDADAAGNKGQADRHLRSTDEVTGYRIKATDGEIGDIEDFVMNANCWKIDYLIVDTGNWLPGKKVIISPNWIKEIQWETSEIIVHATVDQVRNSPEYKTGMHLEDSYEADLVNYYNKFLNQP
jgi:sporulation protein YlmC with PRC-barrel domain